MACIVMPVVNMTSPSLTHNDSNAVPNANSDKSVEFRVGLSSKSNNVKHYLVVSESRKIERYMS